MKGVLKMYVVFNDNVVDSKEVALEIEKISEFKVKEDMSQRSKREDVVAFKLAISIDILRKELSKELDWNDRKPDEDIMDLMMEKADKMASELKSLFEEYNVLSRGYSYTYDQVDEEILMVFLVIPKSLGALKLEDLTKRMLTLV